MSGGSFNYLAAKDAAGIQGSGLGDLAQMAAELGALGYAQDVARASLCVLTEIAQAQKRLNAAIEPLQPVWHAMEWWQSCDWSEGQFKGALAAYRGEELPTCSRCGGTGRERESVRACLNPGCAHGKDTAGVRAEGKPEQMAGIVRYRRADGNLYATP